MQMFFWQPVSNNPEDWYYLPTCRQRLGTGGTIDKHRCFVTTSETTFSDAIRNDPTKIFELCARVGVDGTSKATAADALKDCLELADLLTPAQIRDGLKQVLLSDNPGESLDVLMDSGVMKKILPEVVELDGPRGAQDPIYHSEGTSTDINPTSLTQLFAKLAGTAN
jgi:hypothetical protein